MLCGNHTAVALVPLEGFQRITQGGVEVRNNAAQAGHLIMEGGSVIRNSTCSTRGGAVLISCSRDLNNPFPSNRGSSFTMRGGTIEGNSSRSGGAVAITHGRFNMHDGIIRNNYAIEVYFMGQVALTGIGGGVHLESGFAQFNMHGGIIENNIATVGGGVAGSSGGFLTGGISDNSIGRLVMNGGEIRHNQASYGGGVASRTGSFLFHMHGGEIHNNTANYGGGIWQHPYSTVNQFILHNGYIRNNHATYDGGGVFAGRYADFHNVLGQPFRAFSIRANTRFSGNTAGNGSVAPPINAASVMPRAASVSVFEHQLNNYDVNYRDAAVMGIASFAGRAIGAVGADIDFEALAELAERHSFDFDEMYANVTGSAMAFDISELGEYRYIYGMDEDGRFASEGISAFAFEDAIEGMLGLAARAARFDFEGMFSEH